MIPLPRLAAAALSHAAGVMPVTVVTGARQTGKTDKRCVKMPDGAERCKVAIQTNNLEVDDRGYIYIVDRANTGMHILEFSGRR